MVHYTLLIAALLVPNVHAARVHDEMVETLEAYAVYKMGRYEEAFAAWLTLAQKGNVQGMLNTANMLQAGRGVATDAAAALHWYHRAAQRGDATALMALADAHIKGLGTVVDTERAGQYRLYAAQAGSVEAQRELGLEALAGDDVDTAQTWLQRAADQGDFTARRALDTLRTTEPATLTTARRQAVLARLAQMDDAANARDANALLDALPAHAIIRVQLPGQSTAQPMAHATYRALWQTAFDRADRYRLVRTNTHLVPHREDQGVDVHSTLWEFIQGETLHTLEIEQQLQFDAQLNIEALQLSIRERAFLAVP